ncbi:MAG: ATP-dependent DNA helicase RecG, partial [Terriglobales bacterium]
MSPSPPTPSPASRPAFSAPRPLTAETSLRYLKGVGEQLATVFESRGLRTIEDLLHYLPFRYEDRTHLRSINQLIPGETASLLAQVQLVGMLRTRKGSSMLEMTVQDGSGTLRCTWFHADYLRDRFRTGQMLALYGRVESEGRRLAMRQPEFELITERDQRDQSLQSLKLGRIVPIYEAMGRGRMGSGRIRALIARALEQLPTTGPAALPDPLPASVRQRLRLLERRAALEAAHFPADGASPSALLAARTPAHVRLIFEELFYIQTGLELKRRKAQRQAGLKMEVHAALREKLKRMLPFHPTGEQKRALKEIVEDLRSGHPMRRLLHGDVGSGKTIVALEAAVVAMENGYQVALMAPTQILAAQHYFQAKERLPQYDVRLVTGGTRRRSVSPPGPCLAIGTQALLEGKHALHRLGLVIVDEQHRFGVLQRFHLMQKGEAPAHLLVMTATPIPRTLALSLYGDLDVSLIRELPPGRLPIATRVVPESRRADLYEYVRKQLKIGRQAYFVYPVIEEAETHDLKPAIQMAAVLRTVFPEFRVGLLHGRLEEDEKSAIMHAFQKNEIRILVATTVIEVGVDVPNATVMVIEQAERFGIAQLHQLRGRVGRPRPDGKAVRSSCFLVPGAEVSEVAQRRLEAVEQTEDGFQLAELDLKLRGPGEFFGTRQSGMPVFDIAQPLRDQEIMERARDEARIFLDSAPLEEQQRLLQYMQQRR